MPYDPSFFLILEPVLLVSYKRKELEKHAFTPRILKTKTKKKHYGLLSPLQRVERKKYVTQEQKITSNKKETSLVVLLSPRDKSTLRSKALRIQNSKPGRCPNRVVEG